MTVLTLVRHGQASYMEEDYDRLSALGEAQARKLGEFWARHRLEFQKVFCGPARRHMRTCEIAGETVRAAGLPWPDPVIVSEVDELDAGKLMQLYVPKLVEHDAEARRLWDEFQAAGGSPEAGRVLQSLFEAVARHWCDAAIPITEVESWQSFRERVTSAIARIRQSAPNGSCSVVFTSGGPIAATLSATLDLPPRKAVELIWASRNCSYSEFLCENGRFSLSSFNSHPHLDCRELLTYR
ncbi:MAG TPA: histidine phosphatase family protein [Bryobacteraceae bacterium]|nr:histidine phosphatase family protein [Bryobacteraceae bacterium]